MLFSPYLGVGGGGGGLPRGPGHNLLIHFSSLGSSEMEISETDFSDILTIQNDQISYVKHVLAPLYVFFTLFGGGSQYYPDTILFALSNALPFLKSWGAFLLSTVCGCSSPCYQDTRYAWCALPCRPLCIGYRQKLPRTYRVLCIGSCS